ncbi:SPOR domain-containing protein [bacterium]|nr:SPOR domain-containing protein [Flavobacteriaceae bacterium]MDB4147788.1 SPOR domain-containing protein [bacterium]MDB4023929.1 SPOR domain-containing protein [Flavobacteriaceae bacterium]MDB9871594.1 SPOR domain-containing protein [bacterium]MDC0593163.1 SPOR domain-containing protein [Flavobacteriaceae bacterium]
MQLSKLVSELLVEHDCVTVPGLGSFLGNFKSAHYDLENEKFYPPSKQISFNSQIKANDGLLAKHISEKSNTEYDLSLKEIHQEVIKITLSLKKQSVELKDIGELNLNKEGNIVFTPSLAKNFLKDSFGLSPIYIKELSKEEGFNKKEIAFKPKVRSIKKSKFYQSAAVWACLIFGASSIYYNINNDLLEQKLAYEQNLRNESFSKVQKAVFDLGSLPSLTINVNRKESQFYIIAGAFRVSKNAENLVATLKEKGYDSKVLPLNEKGLNPVAFEGFSNRVEAVKGLRSIQKKENKDAWLLDINSQK